MTYADHSSRVEFRLARHSGGGGGGRRVAFVPIAVSVVARRRLQEGNDAQDLPDEQIQIVFDVGTGGSTVAIEIQP